MVVKPLPASLQACSVPSCACVPSSFWGLGFLSAQAKLTLNPLASTSALLGPVVSPWLSSHSLSSTPTIGLDMGVGRLGHKSHTGLLELQEEGGLLWRKQAGNR